MKVCKTEQEFINYVAPIAQRVCKRYGFLPSILIGQTYLELGAAVPSNFDNEGIYELLKYNNMVGQKANLLSDTWLDYTVWDGKKFSKETPEEYDGEMTTITDEFRIFDSVERSFADYILFLLYAKDSVNSTTYRYGADIVNIKDPEKLITEVGKKYATGNSYARSVMRIVRERNLTKYDDLTGVKPTDIVPAILREEIPDEQLISKGKKVMLDAGHYGYYNQSPAIKEYWESKMTWKLHLMLKEELEKYGIIVGTTRKKQEEDMALYDRGYASKGYDLFLSLHSNAVGDNVNESVDYPVCFVQISGKSDKIGTLLSECVRDIMQTKQPADHWSQQGNHGDYFGVLRGATAAGTVGCIIEHSFHTQTRATKWLLKDENLRKLAVAEARVINDYLVGTSSKGDTIYDPDEEKDYLSKGDSGDAVQTMQMMLIACGYSCGSYGADGDFGSATDNALKEFQKASGLKVNGHYDSTAKSALEKAYKEKTEKKKYSTVYEGLNYSPVYNYTFYKKKYADLRKAFGTNKQKYFEHFCEYGMKEGRQGSAKFNVHKYKNRYKDLRDAFGDDLKSYYKHYIQYGKKEGRKGS